MKKIKVLNISTSQIKYNGISISLLNYYKNIDSKKIQMDFVAPNLVIQELKKEFTSKGNKLFELEYKGQKLKQKKPIKYCIELYKILKREKYDIVHVHGSSSMLFLEMWIAKLAGCQIRIVHCRNTKSDKMLLHRICKPLFWKSYTTAFACGQKAGEFLFRKKEKFDIIANGKDIDEFKFKEDVRREYRKKYNIEQKKVIGHVGLFNYQKNHEYLIEVFYNLTLINPNVCLVLIGDGEKRKEIEEKVKEYKIQDKVIFLGTLNRKEISHWLQALDIMVFPSRFEGFPNVLVEWQIAGLPCVISDKITEEVKLTDLVQFASIEDNPENWAKIIESRKIDNRSNNQEIILNQIEEKGFDIKKNAEKLEKIYMNLIKQKENK